VACSRYEDSAPTERIAEQMNGEVRSIYSYEVDDLDNWTPSGENWSLGIRLVAGPAGEPGEESFDLTVCTGAWLAAKARDAGVFDARHHLVVARYDWPMVDAYLRRRVSSCPGSSWSDVAEKLSRLGFWEFEDFAP
jgi:hypothetical protein